MADPYIGEIRIFAGSFAPQGWMYCEGQTLPISEYESLFWLIGTTYGGDGQTTFRLPDLRGRLPVHRGTSPTSGGSYALAHTGGVEQVTLTVQQIPSHTHPLYATSARADESNPDERLFAHAGHDLYAHGGTGQPGPSTDGSGGGSQPHTNMQPSLSLHFIISLYGIFPSQY